MFLSKGYKGLYDLYYINPDTGKRTKTSTGKTSKSDAQKFRDEFQIDNILGNSVKSRVINLVQLQDDFLTYAKHNVSPSTQGIYKLTLNHFISSTGNRSLALLGIRDFECYKNSRCEKVSKTTVNIELRTLKVIMNYAVRMNYIKSNPALHVKQIPLPQKEKLAFKTDEIQLLISVISDPIIRRITYFGLYTGCRLSEILNLQMKDIDISERLIVIRNKADFKTKTGKIRHIPISDTLLKLLEPNLSNSEDSYLFSFNGVTRLNRDYVSQKFKKYLRLARLPEKYHFHCMRHTFITNLIKNGVPINFVKELAGHSEIQTTMGYVHIEIDNLRKTMDDYKLAI